MQSNAMPSGAGQHMPAGNGAAKGVGPLTGAGDHDQLPPPSGKRAEGALADGPQAAVTSPAAPTAPAGTGPAGYRRPPSRGCLSICAPCTGWRSVA
jgi:hypothetical protein